MNRLYDQILYADKESVTRRKAPLTIISHF